MKLPRPVLDLVLFFTAPFVFLTIALPVGFVMEIGKQRVVVIENRSDRAVRVTPIGRNRSDSELRVLPRTWHPLLPLPAFRAADLDLAPGATRRIVYSARQATPVGAAVREGDGALGYLDDASPTLSITGTFKPADDRIQETLRKDSPAYRWAVLLAGPLGTLVFILAWRARRRPRTLE